MEVAHTVVLAAMEVVLVDTVAMEVIQVKNFLIALKFEKEKHSFCFIKNN